MLLQYGMHKFAAQFFVIITGVGFLFQNPFFFTLRFIQKDFLYHFDVPLTSVGPHTFQNLEIFLHLVNEHSDSLFRGENKSLHIVSSTGKNYAFSVGLSIDKNI